MFVMDGISELTLGPWRRVGGWLCSWGLRGSGLVFCPWRMTAYSKLMVRVQGSDVRERAVLRKQLQDTDARLALAAEALAHSQTPETSRFDHV